MNLVVSSTDINKLLGTLKWALETKKFNASPCNIIMIQNTPKSMISCLANRWPHLSKLFHTNKIYKYEDRKSNFILGSKRKM